MVLTRGLYGKDATPLHVAAVSPVFAGALSLPVQLLLAYVFSLRALYGKRRDIPLHMFHSLLLSVRMVSPGVVRFWIQILFAFSGYQPFHSFGCLS